MILDTRKAPAFSAIRLLKGIAAANDSTATVRASVKNCKIIFALFFPMESRIPISFLRPLIQTVRSRVRMVTLTAKTMAIAVLTKPCRDSKGVDMMSYSSVSMVSFKVLPFSSGKAEILS